MNNSDISENLNDSSNLVIIKLLRLLFILFSLIFLCYPAITLFNVIMNHEKIGEVEEVYLVIYPSIISINILFFLCSVGVFIGRKKIEVFQILINEQAKAIPLLFGIALACSFLSIDYTKFSSISAIKEKKIESVKNDIYEKAYLSSINFVMGSSHEVEKEVNEEVNSKDNNNIMLHMSPNSTQNFLPPNNEYSYVNFFNYLNSKNNPEKGIKGGPIPVRDYTLESHLGENKNILAYLKKDDFSKSATLKIYSLKVNDSASDSCFEMHYQLKFTNKNHEKSSRKFCSSDDLFKGDRLFLNYHYPDKLEAIEVWVTNLDKNYTNENNPIGAIAASEDTMQKNYAVTQGCVEGFNEGIPAEKYKAIIGFIQEGSFITNKPVLVEPGQCFIKDYK